MLIREKPLYPQDLGREAVGHELFLQDGRVAAVYLWYDLSVLDRAARWCYFQSDRADHVAVYRVRFDRAS